jgi:hypothetical protein
MCSGAALTADVGNDRAMSPTGTPGVTPFTVTVGAAATEAAVFFESGALGRTLWNLGRWAMFLNVTTGNPLVTWDALYICRANAAGANQGTVASNVFGTPIALNTGVIHVAASQGADVTALTTDRAYAVLVFTNTDPGPQDVIITPDRGIRMPILLETRVGPEFGAERFWAFDGPTVTSPVAFETATVEMRWSMEPQLDVRGGEQFG